MANVFAITSVTDKLIAEKGNATTVFTVSNTTSRPLRGIARIKPLGNTKLDWIKIEGETERDFPPAGTHQFTVGFNKPKSRTSSNTPQMAESFSFRLDAISASNPDEDFTEGSIVTVQILEEKTEQKKSFPWWILIVLALFLIISSIVGYLVLRPAPSVGEDNTTPTPSPTPAPKLTAVIYDSANFEGFSQTLSEGRYDDANRELTIGNDTLSSLKVPDGLVVRLYEHFHFQGKFIDIKTETPAVLPTWNDRTSSIIVYKTSDSPPAIKKVVIFEHSEYNASNNWIGAFQVLENGRYDGAENTLMIGNDTLSSALVPDGMVLRIYEGQSFQGTARELRKDTPAILLEWNDRVSSLIVYEEGENVP